MAGLAVFKELRRFGGLAGGCSLRARCPLMAGMWLVETVLSQAILFFTGGRRSGASGEREIRENLHIFIDCSGSNQSFAISARQFVLHNVIVLADSALGPGKFVSYRICVSYWSVAGRKSRMAEKS